VRYLVKAKVKAGKSKLLLDSINNRTLGKGSIAGDEYIYNMKEARLNEEGVTKPGLKPASAIHRWPKNGLTGKNILR
jgi:hypothetical protein